MTNGNGTFDGEFGSSDDVRTGFIAGNKFSVRRVRYAAVGGLAVFEGDIVLGTVDELETTARAVEGPVADPAPSEAFLAIASAEPDADGVFTEGIARTGNQFRWPGATIPYTIDAGLPDPQRVRDAIDHWTSNTPISFVEITSTNAATYPDFVSFEDRGGCWSRVGMRGGKQVISLGVGCSTGNAIHEIGHTVGLWHEQSREDRDGFVTIVWQNIKAGKEHNFDQHIQDGDDLGVYDYGSIMHYPATAFSTTGQPTIIPAAGQNIGQRNGLSQGDISAVGDIYP